MADADFLTRAYELARQFRPHPNPRVGAVIVSPEGEVVGEGAHVAAGEPHAEVIALHGGSAKDATVYVSLEPCSHHGRTPPCADALVEAGVSRVVIGAVDPDDRVAGVGVYKLRMAGIDVEVVNDPEAESLDPGYFHHRRTGMPLVTLKYAMTADGSAAAADSTSQWITGTEAREDVHRIRAESDAVVVGAGTVVEDDPRLDVRLEDYDGPQPTAVVLAGSRDLPSDRAIWARTPIIFTTRERVAEAGEVVLVPGDGAPDPVSVCEALAEAGMYDVLVEGGPTVASAWWQAGVVSRIVVYVGAAMGGGSGMSPLSGVFGTIGDASPLELVDVTRLGDDVRIDYVRS